MITGYDLIEKLYSENEYYYEEDEKLYSTTGDNYLDNLLEKAFCEGYEYAQREYASIRNTKKGVKNLIEGNIYNDQNKINLGAKQLKLSRKDPDDAFNTFLKKTLYLK